MKREIKSVRADIRALNKAAAGATGEERLLLLRLQVQARDKEADLRKTEAKLQAEMERSRADQLNRAGATNGRSKRRLLL